LVGDDTGVRDTACLLASVLSERNPLTNTSVDLAHTLAVLKGEIPCQAMYKGWFKRTWKQANRFQAQLKALNGSTQADCDLERGEVLGMLLAHAYPDRVAKLRSGSDNNQYQLANGRSAVLAPNDELVGEAWLAVAEVGGRSGELADRIYSATRFNPANFEDVLLPLVQQHDHVEWDDRAGKFICEQRRQVGKIILSKSALADAPPDAHLGALVALLRKSGLKLLPWTKNLQQWRSRVMLLHGAEAEQLRDSDSTAAKNKWPDLSDNNLLATLEEWLSPYLLSVKRIEDFNKLDLKAILHAQLPWPLPLELERLAPEWFAVPSGSTINIDYTQTPPVLQVKLQEMFGCEDTPSIADGHIPLVVHLLSPARRPLQITQDLAGFWRSGYQDVKKEMKGRYPKHPWPDDPLGAEATRYTKQRAQR
jgi:ATP-dependent helicase HrpB